MKAGMVGLASLYWPVTIGNSFLASKDKGVEFKAAATLGESEEDIRDILKMSPSDYSRKFGVKLYEQAEDMVKSEGLDTVVIATKHTKHAEWVERMARLGMNIFIPKTFVTTMDDAERIMRAQKEFGVKIAVGPTPRFLPQMTAVKQAIDNGLIGKPFSLRICHHHGTIDVFGSKDWYWDAREGGPELSLGWYGIDLAMQLLSDRVITVFADYSNYTSPGSPFMDCGRITMRMEKGSMASFDMYFCNRVPYPSWQLEVLGTDGVISIHRVEGDSYKTVVSLDNAEGYKLLQLPEETPHWEAFWIEDFLCGREPALDAEYAGLVTKISLAARESSERGAAVEL